MNESKQCGSCGNQLHPNDPGGICPSCLIGHAMPDAKMERTTGYSATRFPRVEELVDRFPNLEILHLIGHGGMGAVYLARQTNLDRMVAFKVLSPKLDHDPAFTERFMREARTLARLSHPNIVTVYDYGQLDDLSYLVMEYVDGVNLRDAIQNGKLTPEECLAIIPQICDALQFAHDEGVVHRDIKPENVLLDRHGRVKIADFGLAKLLQPAANEFSLTETQQVMGTRNYMAPEQIEKPEVVDHRADIYSLGVVFYELLTGELPIGRFAAPSEKVAVTNQLDDVVLRSLEKEPSRRFQQASEIRTAVEALPPIQPPPKPEAAAQPSIKPVLSLPFSINDLYEGFATAHGIGHLFPDRLELEYQIVDDVLGAIKSDTRQTTIPLSELLSARYGIGVFSNRIDFQTARLEQAKDIPNNKQGRFRLTIKKSDGELAQRFTDRIEMLRLQSDDNPAPTGYREAKPRVPEPTVERKSPFSSYVGMGDESTLSRQQVIDGLMIPRFGLMAIGILQLILAVKGLIREGLWQRFDSLETSLLPNLNIIVYAPSFDWQTGRDLILFFGGLLMLSIASRLRRPRNYTYVYVALLILIFAPVHIAYVLTFVFSVWALVVLSDGRCKAVFHGEDEGQAKRSSRLGFWAAGLIFAMTLIGGLTVSAVLLYLLLSPSKSTTESSDDLPVIEKTIKRQISGEEPKKSEDAKGG